MEELLKSIKNFQELSQEEVEFITGGNTGSIWEIIVDKLKDIVSYFK